MRRHLTWMVPLFLGLAVAVATPLLGPHLFDTRPPPWQEAAAHGYILPFPDGQGELLVVAPEGEAAALSAMQKDGLGVPAWWTSRVGILTQGEQGASCPCIGPDSSVAVTAYVFLADGRLLGSNDGPEEVARFRKDSNFVPLPTGWWHLGAGPAPQGTQPLPQEWRPLLGPMLERIQGMGEGDVASAVVAEHPHASALGTLYVTLQVDAVAPDGPAPV